MIGAVRQSGRLRREGRRSEIGRRLMKTGQPGGREEFNAADENRNRLELQEISQLLYFAKDSVSWRP
jgi:hypothetical protein